MLRLHLTAHIPPTKTLQYDHDTVLDILLERMLVEILPSLAPTVGVMTKSSPGVPSVLESICVVILLSLSLSQS